MLKNENTVLKLVFKDIPQTSIPPLISTIFAIIELSGLRIEKLYPRYFSE